MKKLLYTLLAVSIIFSACEKEDEEPTNNTGNNTGNNNCTYNNHPDSTLTMIPDANFEQALIYLGYDNVLDGSVYTANINTVTNLNMQMGNFGVGDISDFTGIENFKELKTFTCLNQQVTCLDVSQNTDLIYLTCGGNQLTSLDVSQNTDLIYLQVVGNQLTSLDLSQNTALTNLGCPNNQLTSLDVAQNTALTYLGCGGNQLTSLDVSNNTALEGLYCDANQLTSLDLRNGNNTNLSFNILNNPNLACISVDDAAWSTANWVISSVNIDPQNYFSEQCP